MYSHRWWSTWWLMCCLIAMFNKRLNNKKRLHTKTLERKFKRTQKKNRNKVNEKIILNTACYLFVNQITIIKKKKKCELPRSYLKPSNSWYSGFLWIFNWCLAFFHFFFFIFFFCFVLMNNETMQSNVKRSNRQK